MIINLCFWKNHENSSPSVVLLTGYSGDLSVNSIKRGIYLTNVYYQKKENKTIVYVKSSAYVYISTLCIGMNGSLKLSHENNLDLPSDAIEIPISWQEFSNIWELEELIGVATSEKDGLMPSIQRMTTSYQKDQQKYCKIAEFRNRLTGISMLISVFKD